MQARKLVLAMGLIISAMAISCKEDIPLAEFTHKYEQTQCSDPWYDAGDNDPFPDAAITYLQSKSISVIDSKVLSVNDTQFCAACVCPTGKTLLIKVSDADGQKLMDLNEGWEVN